MRNNKFEFITWIKIFFITFILFTILHPPAIAQVGAPTVNLAFIEQSNCVNVGPNDNGTINFPGIVSVTMNQATRVIVNLSAIDTWNSATVTPKSIVFTNNNDKSFKVTVTAPLDTSFDGTGTVTVTGIWTSYPGGYTGSVNPENGAVARIDINQFFKFSLIKDLESKEIKPGSEIQFELIVTNEGNYIDTFTIDILNHEELSTKGIDVEISQTNIEISEKENKSFIITFKTNKNIKLNDNLIHIQVFSDKGITKGIPPQNLTYRLKIKKDPKNEQDSFIPNLSKVLSEPFSILIILLLAIVIGILLIVYWTKRKIKKDNI